MLNVGPGTKTFLVTGATDLRKSYDTLAAIVSNTLQEDPYSGSLFVFVNRRGNYVKILAWDRTGFSLYAKRLERGRFIFPSVAESQELSEQALGFLLDGIPLGGRR